MSKVSEKWARILADSEVRQSKSENRCTDFIAGRTIDTIPAETILYLHDTAIAAYTSTEDGVRVAMIKVPATWGSSHTTKAQINAVLHRFNSRVRLKSVNMTLVFEKPLKNGGKMRTEVQADRWLILFVNGDNSDLFY